MNEQTICDFCLSEAESTTLVMCSDEQRREMCPQCVIDSLEEGDLINTEDGYYSTVKWDSPRDKEIKEAIQQLDRVKLIQRAIRYLFDYKHFTDDERRRLIDAARVTRVGRLGIPEDFTNNLIKDL